jgi:hypothetical protein
MSQSKTNPFDKEPAEGSRETVDKQLEDQERSQRSEPEQKARPRDNERNTD